MLLHTHAFYLDPLSRIFYTILLCVISAYSGSPTGPAPVNYNPNLGHYGASREFPGSSYPGIQSYATQQAYNPSSGYQPHHYQSQHLTGTY